MVEGIRDSYYPVLDLIDRSELLFIEIARLKSSVEALSEDWESNLSQSRGSVLQGLEEPDSTSREVALFLASLEAATACLGSVDATLDTVEAVRVYFRAIVREINSSAESSSPDQG